MVPRRPVREFKGVDEIAPIREAQLLTYVSGAESTMNVRAHSAFRKIYARPICAFILDSSLCVVVNDL